MRERSFQVPFQAPRSDERHANVIIKDYDWCSGVIHAFRVDTFVADSYRHEFSVASLAFLSRPR